MGRLREGALESRYSSRLSPAISPARIALPSHTNMGKVKAPAADQAKRVSGNKIATSKKKNSEGKVQTCGQTGPWEQESKSCGLKPGRIEADICIET